MQERQISRTGELAKQCVEDSERWFGDMGMHHDIAHHALALAGEVGEFCNIVKKINRGSLHFEEAQVRYNLAMELTDVYTYLLNLAGMLDIDLEESYKIVRAKNQTRFSLERQRRDAIRLSNGGRKIKDNPQA